MLATMSKKPRPKWKRRLKITAIAAPIVVVAMWLAVHHVPGFGPWVANTLRAVFGNTFVAWLEDTAYGVEDWVNRKTRTNEPPKAFWQVPEGLPTATAAASGSSADPDAAPPPLSLANVGAMYDNIATKGDGVWLPLENPREPGVPTHMLKTFVHPDKVRSWAIVAVVAVDLRRVELHAVAGRFEPESKTKEAKDYKRTAVVPEEHHATLLAAFNGGYKSTHGDYGMKIDGITLVPPRPLACTVAKTKEGALRIGSYKTLKDDLSGMLWYRQTPICMYEANEPHPALSMPKIGWGASSVSGTTVIRRSAIGLDKSGEVLFIGVGDFTTGKAIAQAMHHAGAAHIAQLDVNFSFPKFVTYGWADGSKKKLEAVPLTKDFEFTEDQYIGTRSHRDFFYLTRR
jgi:hypothetical protein